MPNRVRILCALVVAFTGGSLFAETFVLTDKQGRSINANVIAVEGDTARIKRDDGRQFDLTISTLVADDQTKLRTWAALPKAIPADAIGIITSRAKFDSTKVETPETYEQTVYRSTGYGGGYLVTETQTRYLVTTTEQWGYSVTVGNRTLGTLTGLRAEYIMFIKGSGNPSRTPALPLKIGNIKSRDNIIVKTDTIPLVKAAYKGLNAKPAGSRLVGIWVRVYRGDDLLAETTSPDSLIKTETWENPWAAAK